MRCENKSQSRSNAIYDLSKWRCAVGISAFGSVAAFSGHSELGSLAAFRQFSRSENSCLLKYDYPFFSKGIEP